MSHANAFRRLHAGPDVLLLANAWDAGSARLVASLGARAIATSSAAVAWTHGYPDGNALPLDRLLATVRAIQRVIEVPLSVDVEGGYSPEPAVAAENIVAVLEAGAVGINLEDGRSPPDLLVAKIAQVRKAAASRGLDVFINARTDVYLANLAAKPARVEESIVRARRYADAGADGIFVPAVTDPAEIRAIASAVSLPLNVLARPGLAPASALASLGVRRLSAGSAIAATLWTRAASLARGFLADGLSDPICADATPGADINRLFAAGR
jgi:2-methylisocitrate lyase-like PEP mutase family enzyme